MVLRPTREARERILLMGPWGSGKSYASFKIADALERGGGPGHVYIVDTDFGAQVMLDSEFPHLKERVTVYLVDEWTEYMAALERINKTMTPDDWMVIDMVGPSWDLVQDYFIAKIFSKGTDEFFLEARKANSKGGALDGYKDWGVINKIYRSSTKHILSARGHVLATSKVEAINRDSDDKEIRMTFGAWGVKPVGQKHTAHLFHTILLTGVLKPGEWTLTTVKDRGRKPLERQPVRDFVMSYLIARAGWRP